MGQSDTVHRAWHLFVGEEERDLPMGVEKVDRLVGVDGFEHRVTQFFEPNPQLQADQRLVLDDRIVPSDTNVQMPAGFSAYSGGAPLNNPQGLVCALHHPSRQHPIGPIGLSRVVHTRERGDLSLVRNIRWA